MIQQQMPVKNLTPQMLPVTGLLNAVSTVMQSLLESPPIFDFPSLARKRAEIVGIIASDYAKELAEFYIKEMEKGPFLDIPLQDPEGYQTGQTLRSCEELILPNTKHHHDVHHPDTNDPET